MYDRSYTKLFAASCLIVLLSGCGGGGGGGGSNVPAEANQNTNGNSNGENNNQNNSSATIVGTWKTDCNYDDEYQQYTADIITFNDDNTYSIVEDWWNQAGCNGIPVESYDYDHGSYEIGTEIRSGVYELNIVSNFNGADYDIFEITNQVLYFGLYNDESESERPTEIDYDYGLVRVNPVEEENNNSNSSIVGTWTTECEYDAQNSVYLSLDITYTSDNTFEGVANGWAVSACEGTPDQTITIKTGTYLLGEEVRAGVHEIDYTPNGEATQYEIIEISDTVIYPGKDSGPTAATRGNEIDYDSPLYRKQ